MKNINNTVIQYLNSLYNETQNDIRLTTAIQKLINGPFPIRANAGNPLNVNQEFLKFLNQGTFETRIGTKGKDRDSFNYVLPGSPKQLFAYEPDDILLTALLNTCIELFIKNDNRENFNITTNEYVKSLYKSSSGLPSDTSDEKMRKHFYDNYLFNYENYGKFRDGAKPSTIANALLKAIYTRVSSWISVKTRTLDPSNLSQTEKQALIRLEESYLSEYSAYVPEETKIEASSRTV